MLRLTFQVMGARQLDRALSRFGDKVRDFRPVWRRIHADFLKIEAQQFDSEGARGGTAWAPLSPSYSAWKAMNYPGRKILEMTGAMKAQLTAGTGMTVEMQPLTLRMMPTDRKAPWHQRGTRRMPARPVVMLTEADRIRWVKMMHEYVEEQARKGGLAR